jgi:hypothetical protein
MAVCPLINLVFAHPEMKIIRLDSQQAPTQVVVSTQYILAEVEDLIALIKSDMSEIQQAV